jgi:molybdopterin molybdotransferase
MRGEDPTGGRLSVRATLTEPLTKSAGRRAFIRVRLAPDPERTGAWLARLAGGQGSHMLSALALANGLAVIPEGDSRIPAGTEVEVIRLDVEIA